MIKNDTDELLATLRGKLEKLRFQQVEFVADVVEALSKPITVALGEDISPERQLINEQVGQRIGDALQVHHAFSRQALSKDRFEFAFEAALKKEGIEADLVANRTNRGHDITIAAVPVSLKTQADKGIKRNTMHISKFMELGSGEWELELLRDQFFQHMEAYDRIFQFRCLKNSGGTFEYELVEIPKELLEKAKTAPLQVQEESTQNPKPGYCYVYRDPQFPTKDTLLFALYFDGGSERKLQIKHICKSECTVHATWEFTSTVT